MPLNLALTASIYAIGGLCTAKLMPWWTMPIALLFTFSRWAFNIHARTHDKGRYPLIEELMLLIMSPLSVGLNEQRRLHLRHHAKPLGSPQNSDYLYYSQGSVTSFVLCLFHPEITFARSLPTMPFWAKVRAGWRCYLFVALWAACGSNFLLYYLLPLRLLFGTGQWTFTFWLHGRGEERTIDLYLWWWLVAIVGIVGMHEFASHRAHHR